MTFRGKGGRCLSAQGRQISIKLTSQQNPTSSENNKDKY